MVDLRGLYSSCKGHLGTAIFSAKPLKPKGKMADGGTLGRFWPLIAGHIGWEHPLHAG